MFGPNKFNKVGRNSLNSSLFVKASQVEKRKIKIDMSLEHLQMKCSCMRDIGVRLVIPGVKTSPNCISTF